MLVLTAKAGLQRLPSEQNIDVSQSLGRCRFASFVPTITPGAKIVIGCRRRLPSPIEMLLLNGIPVGDLVWPASFASRHFADPALSLAQPPALLRLASPSRNRRAPPLLLHVAWSSRNRIGPLSLSLSLSLSLCSMCISRGTGALLGELACGATGAGETGQKLFVCVSRDHLVSSSLLSPAPSSSVSRMAFRGPLQPGPVSRRGPFQPGLVSQTAAAAAVSAVVVPASADAAQQQTTVMLRNLGAEVTTDIVMEQLKLIGMEGRVDLVHAWIDFKTKLCTGVAYVNFFDPADARVLKAMWHGREEMGGIPCHPHRVLNVVFARKQGFDCCLIEAIRPHFKDPSMMAWIHPSKLSPPGFWHPPGLAASPEADGRDRAHDLDRPMAVILRRRATAMAMTSEVRRTPPALQSPA